MTSTKINPNTASSNRPPRPAWAKQGPPVMSYRDAYWWGATRRVGGLTAQLGSSCSHTATGWVADGPATVWIENGGNELTLAQAARLRDALTELLKAAQYEAAPRGIGGAPGRARSVATGNDETE